MLIYFKKHDGVNLVTKINAGIKIHTARQNRIPEIGKTLWLRCGKELAIKTCEAIQEIKIQNGLIHVDGLQVDPGIYSLNSGFENKESMFRFYGDFYEGKLIHFTKKKY